jgi:predicted MPP superfamily phosphohydrolase
LKSGLFFVPALYFLGNYYLYSWATRITQPSLRVRRIILVGLILLLALFPVSKVWGRHDFNSFNQVLTLFSSVWMGLTLLFVLLTLGSDLGHLLCRGIGFPRTISRSRSLAYRRLLAAGIAISGISLGGYAFWEARHIGISRVEIPLRQLPSNMDGFSIVQISDVHYGMLQENGRLAEIVSRVNGLQPDLVVITGDLVDEAVSHMEKMTLPLAGLKSRLGVMAIMGNHEFFAGVERVEAIMRQSGIQVLRNEIKLLPGGIQVLGVDDPTFYRRRGLPLPDLDGLIKRLDPEKPSILLYHQPLHFEEVAASRVGLQLSGHIHGPQFFPMLPVVRLFFPRFRGLYRLQDSYLYVSRGVGTGGPPMRLGSPPELVYIRLRSAGQE